MKFTFHLLLRHSRCRRIRPAFFTSLEPIATSSGRRPSEVSVLTHPVKALPPAVPQLPRSSASVPAASSTRPETGRRRIEGPGIGALGIDGAVAPHIPRVACAAPSTRGARGLYSLEHPEVLR